LLLERPRGHKEPQKPMKNNFKFFKKIKFKKNCPEISGGIRRGGKKKASA